MKQRLLAAAKVLEAEDFGIPIRTAEESRTPSISGCSRSEPSYLAVEVEEEVLVVVVHEEMQMAEDMVVEGWQQRTST